jgi:hypothetical protein
MISTLFKASGEEGGVAVISINGVEVNAMDHMVYGASNQPYPKVGESFFAEFDCRFDDDIKATWGSVFNGNPERKETLVPIGLWSYKAFGRLVSIDGPDTKALADCGGILLPLPIEVSSDEYLNHFVAFDVLRLDVWRA